MFSDNHIVIPVIISILTASVWPAEAQLIDTIAKNHYYEEEIFSDKYLDIYNNWMLTDITGGFSGEGYEADFDYMTIDSIGIFRIYRNDSLFIYGKITIEDQNDDQLLATFDADTLTGDILFDDMQKYVLIDSNSLILYAPCCDRYNYHFTAVSDNQIVNIPDTAFLYALIEEGVDTNGDSLISYAEVEAVTLLDVSGAWKETGEITDMTGIGAFVNLDTLNCSDNSGITSLDVSNCNKLKYLDCSGAWGAERGYLGSLTTLTINAGLEYLNCEGNQLTSLDFSNHTALTDLDCTWNRLSSLDVSNSALVSLACTFNHLTSLDASNCTVLENLECSFNDLTNLEVSNCTVLANLGCGSNQLTNLDVSNNTTLKCLGCDRNQLTNLDVSNNTALNSLSCGNNLMACLDISNNVALGLNGCYTNLLNISEIPFLNEVCVWTIPFPPSGVEIDTTGSPNVYFTTDCTIGIEEPFFERFSISPNPTKDLLTIETAYHELYSIEITSLNGQLIFTAEMEGASHQIDLSSFQGGVYFITVRSKNFAKTEKIIRL